MGEEADTRPASSASTRHTDASTPKGVVKFEDADDMVADMTHGVKNLPGGCSGGQVPKIDLKQRKETARKTVMIQTHSSGELSEDSGQPDVAEVAEAKESSRKHTPRVTIPVKRLPQGSYSNYQRMAKETLAETGKKTRMVELQGYQSIRNDGTLYQTPYEKERAEHAESKKKWMGGDRGFRSAFGVASEIPLRESLNVRASGPYFPRGRDSVIEREEKKESWVAEGWK